LTAIVLTALLASALTVRWSDAAANAVAPLPVSPATVDAIPVTIEGTLVGIGNGLIAVVEDGSTTPVAFTVGEETDLVRGGESVGLDALRDGDAVRLTVDGRSGAVMRLDADPVAGAAFRVPGAAALLAAVGLIGGAAALAIRNLERLPQFPSRMVAARLCPAEAAH
jgi:hypothetical protein